MDSSYTPVPSLIAGTIIGITIEAAAEYGPQSGLSLEEFTEFLLNGADQDGRIVATLAPALGTLLAEATKLEEASESA